MKNLHCACSTVALVIVLLLLAPGTSSGVVDINTYCNIPPFVSQSVPPLVMLIAGRDHKWYYEAYNDAMDLDEDGRLDVGYMHNIDYYGYYDNHKCYTYDNNTGLFSPASLTTDKFCAAGQWSGNVLNWLTMSRMDVLRKVLYGGHRSTDETSSTILERVYIPGDAHGWGKEVTGRLCRNGDIYKNICYSNADCTANGAGYTCVDKSLNLIGINAATASVCAATAVTWSSATNGKILVARYWQQGGGNANGTTHQNLLNSFYTDNSDASVSPLSLDTMNAVGNPAGTTAQVKYITDFNDSAVSPGNNQQNYTNYLAVTKFKTPSGSAGIWQFAIDSDDGGEVEIIKSDGTGGVVASYYGAHSGCFLPSTTKDPSNTTFCSSSQNSDTNTVNPLVLYDAAKPKVCSASNSTTCTTLGAACTGTNGYCVNNYRETRLAASTTYTMIVRTANGVGQGGVKVWYKKPKDTTWTIFGAGELTLTSPTIASGNECAIRFQTFVDTATTTTGENRRHLFCGTTRSVAGTPVLRMLNNRLERAWNWASKERPDCADVIRNVAGTADITLTVDSAKSDTTKIWDYTSRVEVCKSNPGREANCRAYKSAAGSTIYKPAGLLQKYGEGDGTKVCSKTFTKTCTTDANCTAATEGLCIDRAPMFFGLISGSYLKNESGGMLRKDIWSLSNEINMETGQFILPASWSSTDYATRFPQGSIIQTYEQMRTVGFEFTNNSYSDTSATNGGGTCGWIADKPLAEGNCRMWGNPIAEMMYEGLRYFAGKTAPTDVFSKNSGTFINQDGSLPVFQQAWGIASAGTTYSVYGNDNNVNGIFPLCSKPFMLVLSDVNTSYDTDQIPGSKFATFTEDAALPQLAINVGTLTDTIGDTEGISGKTVFIGATTTENNFICTPKTATKLSLIRGLCPEEPTKQGGYYAAAAAYYGHTLMKTNTQKVNAQGLITVPGKSNVTTYSLALSSPVPKMELTVSGNKITIVPMGKSVSGSYGLDTSCAGKCTLGNDALGGLTITNCSATATPTVAGAYCPTDQIVDFYVDTVLYDNSNKITYAKFRINFEDVEQGADHDMDAIVTYEICTGATCSPAINADQVKVSVSCDYAAGSIDQVLGFIVSGTTEDGPYLVVKDKDVGTAAPAIVQALPLTWEHTFTVSANPPALLLENPLWYAAKWGAFTDSNGNNLPDLAGEWDKDGNGVPDNYYLVVNPLKLEQQMDKALSDILNKISSGTAASILSNSEGTGANLLQAVFFPSKTFDNNTSALWIGELHNLWYYLDPLIDASTIREDTDYPGTGAHTLNLQSDYVASLYFDNTTNQTSVKLYQDLDGNGTGDTFKGTVTPDALKSIWRAGKLLWERDIRTDHSPRTLFTSLNGSTKQTFAEGAATTLQPYLQVADDAEAIKIINYTTGYDITGYRSRTVTIGGNSGVWRLGDIVSSTPRIATSLPANSYHMPAPLGYNDQSYARFIATSTYKDRGMAFVGANDGMLHAFKLGTLDVTATGYTKATLSGDDLGSEQWAFIPKNALPYLRYLADPSYNHLYYVDATSTVADVSIDKTYGTCTDYWDCPREVIVDETVDGKEKKVSKFNWRTILIGGMGMGGATRILGDGCTDCVKTPLTVPGHADQGLGYSSYFALDVTNPTDPTMMWEFTDPDLGYATTGPAIIRVGDSTKNGRWFAVFASGPTGSIETSSHQFQGKRDQPLKLFVVDLKLGTLIRTIDTLKDGSTLPFAFGGSMAGGAIDTDRANTGLPGNYKDDAVYFGYVSRARGGTDASISTDVWTSGGVLRLNTYDNIAPAQWTLTKLMDGIGPVTTAIARLQDRGKKSLWLYFGTGRYFFKSATAGIDDNSSRQALYGIKEPCYGLSNTNDLNTAADVCENTPLTTGDLTNQTTNSTDGLTLNKDKGWYINLDAASTSSGAERVVTNTVALTNGAVYFTTFKPTADICGFAGTSFLWATKYNTGYKAPAAALMGKALIQLSTGAFEEVKLGDPTQSTNPTFTESEGRKQGVGMQGKPPADAPLLITRSGNKPVKKILHIQEK
jgi:type IV pilus assembly protein PilY1